MGGEFIPFAKLSAAAKVREPLEGDEKEEEAEEAEDKDDEDDKEDEDDDELGEPCVDLEQSTSAPVKDVYLSVMNCVLNHTK